MEPHQIIVPAAVALAVTAAATPVVGRLAVALGALDRPNPRKVSQRLDMPLMGGIAVALGFAAGIAVALALPAFGDAWSRQRLIGLAVGGALMLTTGAIDDRFGLSAWPKFAVQIVAAAIAIGCGFEIDHVTEPITHVTLQFPTWLIWLVTGLWIVGVTNAINLVDGLDGLATGVAAIIAATLMVIAIQSGYPLSAGLGAVLVGALLGFLPFNFSPARIFLGDTGALFIGYLLSLLALESYQRVTLLTFVVPLLALAVPILDTLLSVLRRLRRGTHIFTADRLHIHHRMLDTHGTPRSAVLQFYFLTGCFCLIALSFTRLSGLEAALFLAAVAVLTLRLLWNLGVLQFEADGPPAGSLPSGAKENER